MRRDVRMFTFSLLLYIWVVGVECWVLRVRVIGSDKAIWLIGLIRLIRLISF